MKVKLEKSSAQLRLVLGRIFKMLRMWKKIQRALILLFTLLFLKLPEMIVATNGIKNGNHLIPRLRSKTIKTKHQAWKKKRQKKCLFYKGIFRMPKYFLINYLHNFRRQNIPPFSIKKIENIASLPPLILQIQKVKNRRSCPRKKNARQLVLCQLQMQCRKRHI